MDIERTFDIKTRSEVVVLDWSEQISHLTVKLNLPPGWRLFSLQGGVSDQIGLPRE